MHEYATSIRRDLAIRRLVSASFLLSFGLGWLLHHFHLSTVIAPPAGAAIFGVVFWVFDRHLWHVGFRGHSLSGIPDLRGTWEGEIEIRERRNPLQRRTQRHRCTVQIKQTWRDISINFKTEFTTSHSVMASLGSDELHYEYDVKPNPSVSSENNPLRAARRHFGTAHLAPQGTWNILKGKFYNDEDYQRWGPYNLTRISR
jgi:hypothetical protein